MGRAFKLAHAAPLFITRFPLRATERVQTELRSKVVLRPGNAFVWEYIALSSKKKQ